jgi:hypothetical protein
MIAIAATAASSDQELRTSIRFRLRKRHQGAVTQINVQRWQGPAKQFSLVEGFYRHLARLSTIVRHSLGRVPNEDKIA